MDTIIDQEQNLKQEWQNSLYEEFEALVDDNLKSQNFDFEVDFFDDEKQEDKLWMARTGLDMETLCGAIETIIFMSDRPISIQKIKAFIDNELPLRVIHNALETLQESYEVKTHGIRLVEVAQGYQFRTKATFSKYVQDLFKVNSLVLTPSALEVLAIVAYKQPLSKGEVAKIRGVDSSHLIKALMDKRLVKIAGRSEELGHPSLYGTTPEFLEVFNLASVDELPPEHELEDMIGQEEVGRISDIKTVVSHGDKSKFVFDEMEELEKLSQSIKSITADTAFTKDLKVQEKKRLTTEGEEVKSAFDLLEEFVDNEKVKHANLDSASSEMMVAAIEPKVIHNINEGPFNLPEPEEEFEMIDLDTGEVIKADEPQQVEETDEVLEVAGNESANDEPVEAGEEVISLFEESDSLDDELSAAFSKLMDDRIDISEENFEDDIDRLEDQIDEITEQSVQDAESLDIDLSFLEGNSEKNSQELPII